MSKNFKIVIASFSALMATVIVYVFTYVPPIPKQHGKLEMKLYLGSGDNQPLIVAFGGGGGGNDWTRNYLKGKRDTLNQKGYSVLAIGYFNANETPDHLDRISLDAIHDSILSVAQHPNIDKSKIILMGGSRGGELALNVASRYNDIKGVIAMSTSNVSFPAITWSANTSSWTFKHEEVAYVPASLRIILPALKGDLYTAHSMMLEDKEAVDRAEIKVENMNGPILIISGKYDDQWPAVEMSDRIITRLQQYKYNHFYTHIKLEGGHVAPLEHFKHIYDFLDTHFNAKQNQ